MDKSVVAIGYATYGIIESNPTGVAYSEVKWLASESEGCRSFKATPEGELKEIYADGKVVRALMGNNGYSIALTTIAALDDIETDWYGKTKTTDGGILETNKQTKAREFALLEVREDEYGKYHTTVYYRCYPSQRLAKESKTSEGSFDPIFPEHSLLSRPRSDGNVCYTKTFNTLTEAKVTTIFEATAGE